MSTIAISDAHLQSVRPFLDGVQRKYKFPNGYGASVIRHRGSYGGPAGRWELGVLGFDGRLTYDTSITNDVIGHLDEPRSTICWRGSRR